MSRYDQPDEPADYLDGDPVNAECSDCGVGFWREPLDGCVWCGECADRRDRWATAQDVRLMLKAVLAVDLSKVRDVA
jgi:hypothetical protein